MKLRLAPYVTPAILGLVCIPAAPIRADASPELDDAVARMQYAYYAGEGRAVEDALGLIDALEAADLPRGMKEYYSAYGRWKLAEIYSEAAASGKTVSAGSPGKAGQECVRQARAARAQDVRMAEAYALEAACSAYGATLLPSGCNQKLLRSAEELDSRNPRIDLIRLSCSGKEERATTAYAQKLRELVTAFEAAPPSSPGKPDWGLAEALVMLGQDYLQRGDPLAARDIIERALVVAPDYRKAQELLRAAARPN